LRDKRQRKNRSHRYGSKSSHRSLLLLGAFVASSDFIWSELSSLALFFLHTLIPGRKSADSDVLLFLQGPNLVIEQLYWQVDVLPWVDGVRIDLDLMRRTRLIGEVGDFDDRSHWAALLLSSAA